MGTDMISSCQIELSTSSTDQKVVDLSSKTDKYTRKRITK